MVIVGVVVRPARQRPAVRRFMRIAQLEVSARIHRIRSRAKGGAIPGGGDFLVARYVAALQREITVAHLAEHGPVTLLIQMQRDAVIRLRRVKLLVEKAPRPIARERRAGYQILQPIGQLVSERQPSAVGVKAAAIRRRLHPIYRCPIARHHVDHRQERIAPVNRRPRAADEFHSLDQTDIEKPLRADACGIIDRIVHSMPVDEQQRARTVIVHTSEPARARVAVGAVIHHIEAPHRAHDVAERPVAEARDFIPCHNGHRRWGIRHFLG